MKALIVWDMCGDGPLEFYECWPDKAQLEKLKLCHQEYINAQTDSVEVDAALEWLSEYLVTLEPIDSTAPFVLSEMPDVVIVSGFIP